MTGILLTQYDGAFLGPIAKLLGFLMEGIFNFLDTIGIPNIGVAIILFTLVIYMLLLPLTIKQQKFSKLSAKMNPELQAIQSKYKNKKDNESVAAMNAETQALYAKYGVSPTGSCVQLAIQMPILMALYRVIYAVPAYVGKVKDVFMVLVDKLYVQDGIRDYIQTLQNSKTFSKQFTNELFTGNDPTYVKNTIIDVLNRASTSEWKDMVNVYPSLSDQINDTAQKIASFNSFLGLNIANSPSFNVKTGWANRDFLIVLGGIMIPLLAALTQWINTKLMPQPANSQDQSQNQMAQSMKTMNLMMPIMSAFFCYTLPIGMGIYWITGAIIRSIQQIIINKHIDKMDVDAIIEKNADKAKKKLEKKKETAEKMSAYASMNTRSISNKANINNNMSQAEKDEAYNKAMSNASKAKPGSIAAKANMVRDYNDRNNK